MYLISSPLSELDRKCSRIKRITLEQTSAILSATKKSLVSPSASQERDPFLPLRTWFLDHFTHPYPDATEKATLLEGYPTHTKQQIDTWFTNMRRRSGWQDLKRRYTNGTVADLVNLVNATERGPQNSREEEAKVKIDQIKHYLREGVRKAISESIKEIVEKGAPKTTTKRKILPRQPRKIKQPMVPYTATLAPLHPVALQPESSSFSSSPSSLFPPSLAAFSQPRYPSAFSSPTSSLRSVSDSSTSSFDSVLSYDSLSSDAPASPPALSSLIGFDQALMPVSLSPPRLPLNAPVDNPYFFTLNEAQLVPLPVSDDPAITTSSLAGFASNGDVLV
ncbi:homeobox domain-containing protein [Sporobolomyces koalae]|uniref:homeobox domain-containing protein n=1 Tax=Sporobolomyces koalae TaxID=500713 RepID=UPI0031823DD7